MGEEKTIHDIAVPAGINARQVALAKAYVSERLQEGFKISEFCSRNRTSSKTWYQWLENADYGKYINKLSDVLIPKDELEAVRKMKKKVMGFADKANVSTAELKIFSDMFSYVLEADARIQAEKLGLNKSAGEKGETEQSLDEKRALLLKELRTPAFVNREPLTPERERELDKLWDEDEEEDENE